MQFGFGFQILLFYNKCTFFNQDIGIQGIQGIKGIKGFHGFQARLGMSILYTYWKKFHR